MSLIEITGREEEYRRQYRLGNVLTIAVAVIALLYGLNMRAGIVNATTTYTDVQAGIEVAYPLNWLIDTDGDYVFRVRDMTRIGYKTTMQIELRPVGPDMTARNVLDALTMTRAEQLSAYDTFPIEAYTLPDETEATAMRYTFVDTEANPFLESVPVVVSGLDILAVRGGQAIIITFRADARTFDDDLAIFNRMLANLEF
jgi:hypothetical protein